MPRTPSFHRISVSRTARYATLGGAGNGVAQVWFACHGYSQLAGDFVSLLSPIDDGTRYIVAPEGLSRFYRLGESGKIGASWMTAEERESEIDDYVAYLDAVYDHVFADLDRDRVSVHVLGFSQGVATSCRWCARGHVRPDHLVMWGGRIPTEFDDPSRSETLAGVKATLVFGLDDEYLRPGDLERETARMESLGLDFEVKTFDGGHRLDKVTLKAIADV